jgi:riboflavin kinase/FMN adenylyltransferase
MEVVRAELGGAPGLPPACVATIGNFDGVHLGHRRLVGEAAASARGRGLPCVAVTFDPHPSKAISPGGGPGLLMTLGQRLDALGALGVDLAWVMPFGRDLSLLAPDDFVSGLLGALGPAELHVGEAFRFGRDRAGGVRELEAAGRASGCEVRAHSYAAPDGGPLSSSRVRRLLLEGDVAAARGLLGGPVRLTGVVVEGERRGRRLGFPTANLAWEQEILPAPGVYATEALCRAGGAGGAAGPSPGVTNVGTRPTFGGRPMAVETHLPGAAADLYGARMELGFLLRLRGEEAFAGPEQLRARIAQDVEIALSLSRRSDLAERPKNALAPLDPKEWAKFDGGWV